MTAQQLNDQINQQRQPDHDFIAWTESGQSSDQVELVDYFLCHHLDNIDEVESFILMTLEDLWQRLQTLQGDKLSRHWRKKVEVMDWQVTEANGRERVRSCSYRPEGVLAVYEEILARQTP
ncbi:hypothetical protein [uncultured Desulfuromonas sp.]|uniref:hypothetical protein n=1 Tax=uncultured Desulfuromonas sp. TaxID=181013 RepID=UPI002AABFBB9|nr:hypothetical protein [uncultured Desulfuromonas sp.]